VGIAPLVHAATARCLGPPGGRRRRRMALDRTRVLWRQERRRTTTAADRPVPGHSFFRELRDRFGAPGDFARAYVIAHEVGPHVQNLMGIAQRTEQQRSRAAQPARNALSVRQELQADCFAGVWGASARQRNLLEPGDVESGISAAGAIGDDRLQRQMGGAVSPESFTHGSAAQRVHWFRVGLGSGDPRAATPSRRSTRELDVVEDLEGLRPAARLQRRGGALRRRSPTTGSRTAAAARCPASFQCPSHGR
jgi:Putative neutral zinc metallopeptidase